MRFTKNEKELMNLFHQYRTNVKTFKNANKREFLKIWKYRFQQDFIYTLIGLNITPHCSDWKRERNLWARLYIKNKQIFLQQ